MKLLNKQLTHSLGYVGLSICAGSFFVACHSEVKHPPNIIYILADDLGYGELGCYGQKLIETPNIDALASTGMLFTQHYAGAPVSAPSRAVLLTGNHTGHVSIRGNSGAKDQKVTSNYLTELADSTLEGQRPLLAHETTIAQYLKKAGYTTGIVGKWGLGAPHTHSTPLQKGFDFFYGYNCQRQAHTYYPVHLYKNDQRVYLGNDTVAPHTKLLPDADPYKLESYDDYSLQVYAPDLMFKELLNFVQENKDRPFFMYWATPIPHVPIQAPNHWIKYYVDKFGDEEPYLGDEGYFPHRYPHAGYAAMVSYLDEQVGLLVQQLKKMGVYENTLIIFTSDNGPTYNGGTDSFWFDSASPFESFRGRGKGYLYEGGIRVPMIANWPKKIKGKSKSNHLSAFQDVLPTLCEVANVKIPWETDGISFLPELTGNEQSQHKYLYWEFPQYGGQQAVRMGPWKGIRKDIRRGNMNIELFNLEQDIQEKVDIALEHQDIVQQIETIMLQEHVPSDINEFKLKQLGD